VLLLYLRILPTQRQPGSRRLQDSRRLWDLETFGRPDKLRHRSGRRPHVVPETHGPVTRSRGQTKVATDANFRSSALGATLASQGSSAESGLADHWSSPLLRATGWDRLRANPRAPTLSARPTATLMHSPYSRRSHERDLGRCRQPSPCVERSTIESLRGS
jgi:hypothetical protein